MGAPVRARGALMPGGVRRVLPLSRRRVALLYAEHRAARSPLPFGRARAVRGREQSHEYLPLHALPGLGQHLPVHGEAEELRARAENPAHAGAADSRGVRAAVVHRRARHTDCLRGGLRRRGPRVPRDAAARRHIASHVPVRLSGAGCAWQGEGGEHERDGRLCFPRGGACRAVCRRPSGLHHGAAAHVRDGGRGVRNPHGDGRENCCAEGEKIMATYKSYWSMNRWWFHIRNIVFFPLFVLAKILPKKDFFVFGSMSGYAVMSSI